MVYQVIGSISMGGYIALRTAFKHPDIYGKAGGHSPALYTKWPNEDMEGWLYPDEKLRQEGDPFILAKSKDLSDLKVYIDCGDKDSPMLPGCEKLHSILRDNKVNVKYFLSPGAHTNEYWYKNLASYFSFYAGN